MCLDFIVHTRILSRDFTVSCILHRSVRGTCLTDTRSHRHAHTRIYKPTFHKRKLYCFLCPPLSLPFHACSLIWNAPELYLLGVMCEWELVSEFRKSCSTICRLKTFRDTFNSSVYKTACAALPDKACGTELVTLRLPSSYVVSSCRKYACTK